MSRHRPGLRNHLLSGLVLFGIAGAAVAQTVTVTTSDDAVDIPYWTGTIADLPGPDGLVSFGEALIATDNTLGHQTIEFAIPESEWWLPTIYPGQVLLYSMLGWSCSDSVTIDGTTQTAFTGDTYPDGHELMLDGLTLYIGGDNSVVKGFNGSHISISGSNCEIHDNTGDMSITVYSGSGSLIHDNEADTIKVDRSNDNVIVRNTTRRVRIDGWFDGGDPATNNRIGGPDPADRNFITGWGNYGEHGLPGGTTLELFDTLGTLVQNNSIGTTPDGLQIGAIAATVGVGIENQNRDLVIRDNLIAASAQGIYPSEGHYGAAIYIEAYGGLSGFTDNVEIVGNTLGLDANGAPVLGGVYGIRVSRYAQESARDVRIGGPLPGQGNVIAGHDSNAVFMEISPGITPPPDVGIRVSGNSIHDSGDIGIDLTPNTWTFGPTPNDPFDDDVGANGLQNYPVILLAEDQGTSLHLVGSLDSSRRDAFTLEFFASPDCDASGFGPGQLFLGSTSVITDSKGSVSFDLDLPVTAPAGWVVTATATLEPVGRTSEFSACEPVTSGAWCQADLGFGGPGVLDWQVCGDVLATGGGATASLTNAPAFAPAWFVYGLSAAPTPFKGGQLVPVPILGLVVAVTDAGGELSFPVAGGGGPATLITQWVVQDGPTWLLSNALELELLP